jgi:hypothetical protein
MTPIMTQTIIMRQVTVAMLSLLAAALFVFCAMFARVNRSVGHSHLGTPVDPVDLVR